MSSPEHKRDTEDKSDVKNDRARDEEDSESNDKRKQRSKRSVILEDIEGVDSSGRRRSSTEDRNESRKRTAGSSKTVSDEVDYEAKKVSCSIFCEKEERSVDSVKSKSKIRSKAPEEVNKGNSLTHEGISGNIRRSEPEKDGFRDDRSKGRDDSWSSRDNWKRRLPNIDKSTKDRDTVYDHGREWEYQRRGRERFDRTEAVKTSSKYGISNENYDVIEIQTKPFSYGREELRSSQQSDTRPPPNDEEYAYPHNNRETKFDLHGPAQSGEDSKDRFMDDGPPRRDQNSWRDDFDFQDGKARGQISSTGSISRSAPQGIRGNRIGRGGRGQLTGGRDSHQVGIPLPMTGSPFGPLRMPPPGAMQPLTPILSPGPGFPISPGVFVPGFSPIVWPGPRDVDMNLLPVPPGPTGPGFSPNIGTPPNPAMFLNQPCHGREGPPNISVAGFNSMVLLGSGQPQEKTAGGWVPPRSNGPHSKAPSRGEQDDYSQNFVDTGMRPQNYIRELELTSVVEDYPKLRELIQRKDEIVANSATAPMYYKCDLREQVLSPEFFGTKFDAILVDPPWEEYVHRAPGVTDHMEYWTFEEIMNLKIEAIADTPSFIFLWVGDGVGLEQGRQCLKKWGFRRCEDICWVKTNKTNATPGSRHDSHTLFQRSKEHCLMGIKGTVRRSTDGHIIHANIDTDVIVAEEPPYGSTAKPEDMYRIIEHFSLGRRRLELFGEDHNIRSGWLTIGKDLSSSNFNSEAYIKNFADKDGKIWQGRGGRNPPPESSHLVVTTPDIESLRPKSPMKNQYQMQQQQSSTIISVPTSNSTSNWPTGNSPHNHNAANMNQEASGSNISDSNPWSSEMEGFRGGNMGGPDNGVFDMYGYNNNVPFPQPIGDYLDYESRRGMNML